MKLSCALVACNENPKYLDFWPLVRKAWWDIVGIPCVMVYVGEELPEHLRSDPAVRHFKPIQGWPTATQAQVIRLLQPSLLKGDGAILLSDMDMIPMQRAFFEKGVAPFEPNQFVSLRGVDEVERQIQICQVAAAPKTWSEMFDIQTEDQIRQRLQEFSNRSPADGEHGGIGWCSDQQILQEKVKEWQITQPNRIGLLPWTAEIPRLDRGNPMEWIQWNPDFEMKLAHGAYVDFHMPPQNAQKPLMDRIYDFIVNKK